MWVRGLKPMNSAAYVRLKQVAPHVGAWIETLSLLQVLLTSLVSHPMWVRGLKLLMLLINYIVLWSHPMWVRGLKLSTSCIVE